MRPNIKKRLALTLSSAVCAVLLLASCGTEPSAPESSDAPAQTQADAGALIETQEGGDIQIFRSLTALTAVVPVVLTGTIQDIAPGLTIVGSDEGDEYQTRWEHAVVRVRIDSVYKSEGVELGGKFAYVVVPLGVQSTDLSGKPLGDGPSTIKPISDLEKGLPTGTRVVVATSVFSEAAGYGNKYLNADVGSEPGAPLLHGNHPQTFSIEDGATRQLSGWDSTTYDQATAELQKTFG